MAKATKMAGGHAATRPGVSANGTVTVPVQPMTAMSFAPYGRVFGAEAVGAERDYHAAAFTHDGRVTLGTLHQPCQARRFTRLERHFGVTQAFVQLSGTPSVVCVAPPTALDDLAAVPAPESVRGFLIDPALGYYFHVGTWHSLDRFPLAPPGGTFLIVNVDPNPTQMVDFASGALEMHDDLGVSAPRHVGDCDRRGIEFILTL